MASKSKTKTKIKLKRKEFVIEGKIIDLQRFAFDIFAHSAAKFGVPDGCIVKLQEGENDYGFPDFIVVLSRFIFRCQVKGRNLWYTNFKPYYESTKFKSLESIKNALRQVLSDTVKYDRNLVSHEAIITLALISELILFLYTENCLLYLQELGNFWSECWCCRKKELEKSGGLVGLYHNFNNPDETKVDIFFNEFIPVYCIPYDGSRELQNVFNEEFKKFFKLTEEKIDAMEKEIRETAAGKDALVRELASQLSIAHEAAQKPRRALRVNKTPRNTGLGIRKHEDLLRDVLGTDTKTSSSLQSKSDQKSARDRRGSATQKESRTKKSSLGKMVASPEQPHTVVLGAAAASFHDEDSDNETFVNTGLGIRTHEDLLRDVFGTNIVSPEEATGSSRQKTANDRKKSANKKKDQKKISSPLSTMAVSQPLETGPIGAEAALKTLDDNSERETTRNTGLGFQTRDELMRHVYGYKTASSPEDLSIKHHQKTAKDYRGSYTQKERRTKKSSLGKMVESPEQSHTDVLGATAASFHDEESDNETFVNTCLGIRTHEDLLRDVFGTNIVSPEEATSSSRQKTAKGRKKSAKKNQKKISSPLSTMAVSQPLETGLIGAESTLKTLDDHSERETIRNTGLGFQTHEELMRHVFGFETASSPEDLSSKHHQETAKDRRGSSTQKERRTKKASLGKMVASPEQSPTVVLGAETPSFLDEESDNETFVNTCLGIRTHEDLLRDVFGTNIVSPEEATSSSRQKTAKDPRGSASKKKNQKKISGPSSTVASPESLPEVLDPAEDLGGSFTQRMLEISPLGAEAASSSKKHEDSGKDEYLSDFGMTVREFLYFMGIRKRLSSDSD